MSLFYLGELTSARDHLERVIDLYNPQHHGALGYLAEGDLSSRVHIWSAWVLWYLGYPEQALTRSIESCTLAKVSQHPHGLVFAILLASRVHQYRREAQAVRELAEALIALSIEHGFPMRVAAGTFMRGWALFEQGHQPDGIAQMHQGMEGWRATGTTTNQTYFCARLAESYGKTGEPKAGLRLLAEAL